MTNTNPSKGAPAITIYGRRAVLEALATDTVEVQRIAHEPNLTPAFRKDLRAAARARNITPEELPRDELSNITADPRNDQGVAAHIHLKLVQDPDAFAQSLTGRRAASPTRILALDGVTNPQNIGMIVRSALASGFHAMLWPTVGSPWVSGLIIKASAATVYKTTILPCRHLADALIDLQRRGFSLIGLDAAPHATPLQQHSPPHRALYIVGSETHGLSQQTRDLLDHSVRIPIAPQVESLNAAVAASLVCFHASPLSD